MLEVLNLVITRGHRAALPRHHRRHGAWTITAELIGAICTLRTFVDALGLRHNGATTLLFRVAAVTAVATTA